MPANACYSPPDSKPCEPWILGAVLLIALQICGQVSLGNKNKLDFNEFWIAFDAGMQLKVIYCSIGQRKGKRSVSFSCFKRMWQSYLCWGEQEKIGLALERRNVCPAAIEIFFCFSSPPAEVSDICLKDLQLFVVLLFNCTRILCQEVEYSSPAVPQLNMQEKIILYRREAWTGMFLLQTDYELLSSLWNIKP